MIAASATSVEDLRGYTSSIGLSMLLGGYSSCRCVGSEATRTAVSFCSGQVCSPQIFFGNILDLELMADQVTSKNIVSELMGQLPEELDIKVKF